MHAMTLSSYRRSGDKWDRTFGGGQERAFVRRYIEADGALRRVNEDGGENKGGNSGFVTDRAANQGPGH